MDEHQALIAAYRVDLSANSKSIFSGLPYAAGALLLIAPLVPGLALPMAVLSLGYFLTVFMLLAMRDLSRAVLPGLEKSVSQLKSNLFARTQNAYCESVNFLRYVIALRKARALWETRFFSSN
jgi:hypothetical protein